MIIEKLKSLFTRGDMPDETKSIFEGATTTTELLHGLDELLTRNELEFNEINREIGQLEEIEQEEMEKIRSGEVQNRVKQNTLLYIKRLRKQMDNLQNRLQIYDKNINLHINLIAKIQDMEAMALKGVDEQEIDSILIEFQTNFEKYMNTVIAGEAAGESLQTLSAQEQNELKELEDEILSTAPEEEEEEEDEDEELEEVTSASLKEEVQRELDREISLDDDEELDLEDLEDLEELEKLEEEKEKEKEDDDEASEPPHRRLLEAD